MGNLYRSSLTGPLTDATEREESHFLWHPAFVSISGRVHLRRVVNEVLGSAPVWPRRGDRHRRDRRAPPARRGGRRLLPLPPCPLRRRTSACSLSISGGMCRSPASSPSPAGRKGGGWQMVGSSQVGASLLLFLIAASGGRHGGGEEDEEEHRRGCCARVRRAPARLLCACSRSGHYSS